MVGLEVDGGTLRGWLGRCGVGRGRCKMCHIELGGCSGRVGMVREFGVVWGALHKISPYDVGYLFGYLLRHVV